MKVIVVGAGSFGSWSALQLQRAGCEVTLVDAWGPGNSRSSSGGETRVIRTVYGQDHFYVEMAHDAINEWDHFQQQTGEALMEITGSLWFCGADDSYVRSTTPQLNKLGLQLQELTVSEAASRFPQVDFSGLEKVYLEPLSGFLRARQACAAVTAELVRLGGSWIHDQVVAPPLDRECHQVELRSGRVLSADQVVLAAGPWLRKLFPDLLTPWLRISRQEVYYFGTPAGDADFEPSRLPIWLELNEPIYYGIPTVDRRGFKVARDQRGEPFDPDTGDRVPTGSLVTEARQYLARRFPRLAKAPLVESRVCQYSNTPDGHFLLDRHMPSGLVLVGGGSGHGFKMGPAVGRRVADLVMHNQPAPPFQLDRFASLQDSTTQFEHA